MTAPTFLSVDDQPISLTQALQYLQTSGKLNTVIADILRQYVLEQEVAQYTTQHPETPTDITAIEQTILDFRLQNNLADPNTFKNWLEANTLTYPAFRDRVANGLKFEKFKASLIDPKLQEYFVERKLFLDRVVLSRIVVTTQDQAEELKTQLEEGASFELLAREYSLTDDRLVNGMLGPVSRGTLPDAIRATIDIAVPGQVVGPLAIEDDRWALFRLEQVLPATLGDNQLQQMLRNELFDRWLSEKLQVMRVQLQLPKE